VRHALRYYGLLRVEANQARVSQSGLETGGGVTWVVHVASSWRLRRGKSKTDGSMQRVTSDHATFTLLFLLY
jgi:hypothetical protein